DPSGDGPPAVRRLAADARQDAALLRPRPDRYASLRREPEQRHRRDLRDRSGEREAETNRRDDRREEPDDDRIQVRARFKITVAAFGSVTPLSAPPQDRLPW